MLQTISTDRSTKYSHNFILNASAAASSQRVWRVKREKGWINNRPLSDTGLDVITGAILKPAKERDSSTKVYTDMKQNIIPLSRDGVSRVQQ